jgi:hypothetical protein
LCVTARADQGIKNVGTDAEAMCGAPGVVVCKLRVGFAIHSEDSDPWPARRVLRELNKSSAGEWVLVLEPCLANMVDWGVRGTNKAAGARDRLRAGATFQTTRFFLSPSLKRISISTASSIHLKIFICLPFRMKPMIRCCLGVFRR